MAIIDLKVAPREAKGKNVNRRLRAAGKLPVIVYGGGNEESLSVELTDFLQALHDGDGVRTIFHLQGTTGATPTACLREIQRDPVDGEYLHADFRRVDLQERMRFKVPVRLKGSSIGVRLGGVINQLVRVVTIECKAGEVPTELPVDVSNMSLNARLSVADLNVPEGVKILALPQTIVVQVIPPRGKAVKGEVGYVEEEGEASATPQEPELIGKKKDDEAED